MKESNENLAGNLNAFLRDLLKYWYFIVFSLFMAVAIAFVYTKFAAKKFKIGSSVLLKIENNKGYGGRSDDIMEVASLIEQDKNFQNELYYLQSTPLIREVVNDMDLRINYYQQEDKIPKELEFSLKNIYKSSPFIVIPNEDHVQPIYANFYVKIIDEERFFIALESKNTSILDFTDESLVAQNIPLNFSGTFKFGEQIEGDYYSFKILLNSNYNPTRFQDKDLFFRFNNLLVVAGVMKGSLTISQSSIDATMADLYLRSDNINLGIEFLNKLIEKYINRNLEEKNFLANQTIEYIDRQLSSISDSLGVTERQLQNLRSASSVMNIDEKADNIYQQLQGLQIQRDESQRKLNYLLQMDEYFESNKDSSKLLAPSSMGLGDPLLNSLIQELTTLNSERQTIISNDQLRNPRLQTLNVSIDNLKTVINENISFSISTTRKELDDLENRIKNLNVEFNRLPYTQRQLLGIERKFKLNDAIYTSLLEKRIQAQIIKSSNLPDCEVIDPPRYLAVASPNNLIILFIAVFLGILLPTIIILSRRFFGDKVLEVEEIKSFTSLPVIGSLPTNPKPLNNVVLNYPKVPIAEAFHTIRSNLIYYLYGKESNTILVTSTLPSEGKSFTSLNLATSFAMTNNRTVLLQFDLRKPSKIFNELGTKALVGISSYLIDKATLDEIIIPTEIPNLDLIQAGQIPPNPVELISSVKNRQLFDELKKKYDYIIVDSPPYGLVTDSFILMNYVDIKLYVSRLGTIKRRALISNLDDVVSKGIKDIYLLVNDNNALKKSSYTQYAYEDKDKKGKTFVNRILKGTPG